MRPGTTCLDLIRNVGATGKRVISVLTLAASAKLAATTRVD